MYINPRGGDFMFIHSILQGFIDKGLDDYLVKAITTFSKNKPNMHFSANKVIKEVWVHPNKGKPYMRHQQVNADEVSSYSKSTEKVSFLDKEAIPGVTWKQLIGTHEDDSYLSIDDGKSLYLPRFHELYTKRIKGMKTKLGTTIIHMDYDHFPKRIDERGYRLVKDKKSYETYIGNKNPDYAIRSLAPELQKEIRSLTKEQEDIIANYVYEALTNPLATFKGSSTLTPQGSTVYVTLDCCVVVVNLPDKKGVVKTFYSTRDSYKRAIQAGWDGSVSIEEFRNSKK